MSAGKGLPNVGLAHGLALHQERPDAEVNTSGLAFVMDALDQIGYRATAVIANAKDFLLPHNKSKLFVVAILAECTRHHEEDSGRNRVRKGA